MTASTLSNGWGSAGTRPTVVRRSRAGVRFAHVNPISVSRFVPRRRDRRTSHPGRRIGDLRPDRRSLTAPRNRRLAWQTTSEMPVVGRLFGGRIWRYELEPIPGGTRVRESWDISHEKVKAVVRPLRKRTREAMD